MIGTKRAMWLPVTVTLLFLSADSASAGGPGIFHHRDPDDYSPWHYRTPLLWRLCAHFCGVEGEPVSVYPQAAEEKVTSAPEEAGTPSTSAPPAEKIPAPLPEVPNLKPEKRAP